MVMEGGGAVFPQTNHVPDYFAHFGPNTRARTSGRDWTLSQDVLIADAESLLLVSEEHQQVRQANLQHRRTKFDGAAVFLRYSKSSLREVNLRLLQR